MLTTDQTGLTVALLAEGRVADWAITLIAVCAGLAAAVWLWRNRSGS